MAGEKGILKEGEVSPLQPVTVDVRSGLMMDLNPRPGTDESIKFLETLSKRFPGDKLIRSLSIWGLSDVRMIQEDSETPVGFQLPLSIYKGPLVAGNFDGITLSAQMLMHIPSYFPSPECSKIWAVVKALKDEKGKLLPALVESDQFGKLYDSMSSLSAAMAIDLGDWAGHEIESVGEETHRPLKVTTRRTRLKMSSIGTNDKGLGASFTRVFDGNRVLSRGDITGRFSEYFKTIDTRTLLLPHDAPWRLQPAFCVGEEDGASTRNFPYVTLPNDSMGVIHIAGVGYSDGDRGFSSRAADLYMKFLSERV